jgi:hypothetical protein
MPSQFKPAALETVEIFGQPWTVQQHPAVNMPTPYAQEGGRATVFQLRDPYGRPMALKVFKAGFREPSLAHSGSRLAPLSGMEGMAAAERRVVLLPDTAIQRFPALEYALMMPWMEGETWAERLVRANNTGEVLDLAQAVRLCERFLYVVKEIEAIGDAHTDIACGNVVVHLDSGRVDLLDLEDMYIAGWPPPEQKRGGSPDYCHRAGESVICPEGDRFASALLAAEMLLLTRREFVKYASDTGMFGSMEHGKAHEHFAEMFPTLRLIAPEFAELFERAWNASALAACPRVSELHASVRALADRTQPIAPPPVVGGVIWVKPGGQNGGQQPPVEPWRPTPPTRQVAPPPPSSNSAVWSGVQQPVQSRPLQPVPAPPGQIPIWLIVVAALVLAGLLFFVIVQSQT